MISSINNNNNNNTFKITVNDPWFTFIKSGSKKYEGRCYWKSVLNYKVGDILIIHHHTDSTVEPLQVKIISLLLFKTFEEALQKLPIEEILPDIKSIEEGINIYLKFYSLETQYKYGVCMIEIATIDKTINEKIDDNDKYKINNIDDEKIDDNNKDNNNDNNIVDTSKIDAKNINYCQAMLDTDDIKEVARRCLIVLGDPDIIKLSTTDEINIIRDYWKQAVLAIEFFTNDLPKTVNYISSHNLNILEALLGCGIMWTMTELDPEQFEYMHFCYKHIYLHGVEVNIYYNNNDNNKNDDNTNGDNKNENNNNKDNENANTNNKLENGGIFTHKYNKVIFIDDNGVEYNISHDPDTGNMCPGEII